MLHRIIDNTDFGSSLLVLDNQSTSHSGQRIVHNLTSILPSRPVLLHDGVTDPILTASNCKMAMFHPFECDEIFKQISQQIDQSAESPALIINCVSLITLLHGVFEVANLLRRIRDLDCGVKVIGLAHRDVLNSESTINDLSFLFDTVIDLELYSAGDTPYHCIASCLKREPSGKIVDSKEVITWDSVGRLVCQSIITNASATDEDSSSQEVINKLTFNLNLSDNEKQARNALQLPYLKKESEKKILLSKAAESLGRPTVSVSVEPSEPNTMPAAARGKIYYQYDDADDFDDEDPDDDLDI